MGVPTWYPIELLIAQRKSYIDLLSQPKQALEPHGHHSIPGAACQVESGRVWEVESLLQRPQNPNFPDQCGRTALFCAAEKGDAEIVRLLLEASKGFPLGPCYGRGPYIPRDPSM